MRTSRLILATLLCLASLSAAAQVNDTYVIPASANLGGANNTRWLTQLSIFNPHLDYPLTISVTFLPSGGATGVEKLIDLPENATFLTDNALGDIFGRTGSGSLLIATFPEDNPGVPNDILSRSFLVNSNTFNNAAGGTYGQTIPGTWTGLLDYDYDEISSISHGIDNSSRLKYRTNVGAVNLGRCNVTVRVNVYDADGNKILNQAPFGVPPLGHMQQLLPIQVEGGSVEFFVDDPCWNDDQLFAVVFPYTSTIDDLSGDPKYQSPTLLAPASVLYGKKGGDMAQLGKKIDSSYARKVRDNVAHAGRVSLKRTQRGWVVE